LRGGVSQIACGFSASRRGNAFARQFLQNLLLDPSDTALARSAGHRHRSYEDDCDQALDSCRKPSWHAPAPRVEVPSATLADRFTMKHAGNQRAT
jgi:hypothetical protein